MFIFLLFIVAIFIIVYFKYKKQKEKIMQSEKVLNDMSTSKSAVNDIPYHNHSNTENETNNNVKNNDFINPPLLRTERENNLSFNFSQKHAEKIEQYENDLYNAVSDIEGDTIQEEIENCEKAISIYDSFKAFCYKTKGGTIYFQDMWEYCYNSSNHCFSYIDSVKEQLEHLNNLQNGIDDGYKFFNLSKELAEKLENLIKNNPGILQKNIYAEIDISKKESLRNYLSFIEGENKIQRNKKGNSYELFWLSDFFVYKEQKDENDSDICESSNSINDIIETDTPRNITNNSIMQRKDHVEEPKKLIIIDNTCSNQIVPDLNIPDEILNLLWIKGGPLDNYTQEVKNTNAFGVSISITKETEPSLIDTSLLLNTEINDNDFMTDIGYFPSYSKLSPKRRYVYLSWLQDISKPVAIGYVFIFYYGLERHLMFGKYKEAIKIISYLQQYHDNSSFYSYSTDAMLISIVKHNDPDLLCYVDLSKVTDSVYAFVKCILNKGYYAEDIVRLRKIFNFTNTRYIKNQYVDFVNAVRTVLVDKFALDYYPLPNDTITNCTKNETLAIANYSIDEKDRFASIPDISSNIALCSNINGILVEAHELVKADNRKNRSKNKN